MIFIMYKILIRDMLNLQGEKVCICELYLWKFQVCKSQKRLSLQIVNMQIDSFAEGLQI